MEDVPALDRLIGLSARELGGTDYSREQIEAALGNAWGVDTQLIHDRTFFVVMDAGEFVGCGGWSKRKTLFGADARAEREPGLLDPSSDSARIRAFFVHPTWARQGVGTMLLRRCEAEAKAAGFRSAELVATLPGERLYARFGYVAEKPVDYPLGNGLSISFVRMKKSTL